jgi:hypothetical protein
LRLYAARAAKSRQAGDVFRGNSSLWIYDRVIFKLAGEISDGRLPDEPMRIA